MAAAASLTVSVALAAQKGLGVLLTLLSPLVVGVVYSTGPPSMSRLKDILGVKNLTLATAWAAVPTLVPILVKAGPAGARGVLLSLMIFSFIFVKAMINTILFDVRDVRGDSSAGVRTLPVVLGVKAVYRLLILLNMTLVLWVIACGLLGFFLPYLPILAANLLYTFWYIHFFTRNLSKKRILTDLLVDGEWAPLTLLITLVHVSSWSP
ncbi:MAG: UbiA family prenyltransferase [Candidatus Brockarchaeota archaeon]|nr:UbiA family prenyltransferase [Candidatus Brockarchaeota archaeon]